jgi:hypothetical protein
MRLKKTKLAGLISLLLCSPAMAETTTDLFEGQTDASRFGPFVSAMSADASTTATYTQTYAQSFGFDIGAPWTYNDYCVYDSNICEMLWDGSSDSSDGLMVWRANILSTHNGYNGTYNSETSSKIGTDDVIKLGTLDASIKVTAVNGSDKVGYATLAGSITRRGFYNDTELLAKDFTGTTTDKGGFSAAHDFVEVSVSDTPAKTITYTNTLVVGQSSVNWANADDSSRFSYCFDFPIQDDRRDYDDLYYCPGFDLQASYWKSDGTGLGYFTANNSATTWIGSTGGDATYIANAYAINTSGFAVGFSTQQIYSSVSGGRARATIFKPTVTSNETITYAMESITKPKTEAPGESNKDNVIRDTVAIDITDKVYNNGAFEDPDGSDNHAQPFIVVGNRTFEVPQNGSDAIEFYTFDVKTEEVRYPFQANPIKGANSQVSKINNDGLAIGWRDARGAIAPTNNGSLRFQSAFIYDYKTDSSAYLDDIYCKTELDAGREVKYRLTNAISISENNAEKYTIIANGYDYKNQANYTNKTDSTPAVFKMIIDKADITDGKLPTTSQCPIKEDQDYERQGASMNWFILLPMMMLFFRRFKR